MRMSSDRTFATELEFLRTELHSGLTLAKLSRTANHSAKSERNRANARKAYDAVLRFMGRVLLTGKEAKEVNTKLNHLKSELRKLGEDV
jgi:hypothetical protein